MIKTCSDQVGFNWKPNFLITDLNTHKSLCVKNLSIPLYWNKNYLPIWVPWCSHVSMCTHTHTYRHTQLESEEIRSIKCNHNTNWKCQYYIINPSNPPTYLEASNPPAGVDIRDYPLRLNFYSSMDWWVETWENTVKASKAKIPAIGCA